MTEALEPFLETNRRYEAWMAERCAVVAGDLKLKHERMAGDAFIFLRGTYFRWASTIEWICPHLADAPNVMCSADMHLENFGTWRDAEGRLMWGVNDFDESAEIAWPFDLVRLLTSVRLASGLMLKRPDAARALLEGYRAGLAKPTPVVLDEGHGWLHRLAACPPEDRARFWEDIQALPRRPEPPATAKAVLMAALPEPGLTPRWGHRISGVGSLGRPRSTVTAAWRGGHVVREAKAALPSAWDWAHGRPDAPSNLPALGNHPERSPDPYLQLVDGWVLRRLSPDQRKAELGPSPGAKLQLRLLQAMGREVGGLHALSPHAPAVRKDLAKRPEGWLHKAAKRASQQVLEDWEAWKARPAKVRA